MALSTTGAKDDIAAQYDQYYSTTGDGVSIYDRRLVGSHKPFTIIEREFIWKLLEKSIEGIELPSTDAAPITIRVADFGCGNGRTFAIIREFADILLADGKNVRLEIVAIDPSGVGLQAFQKSLITNGFTQIEAGAITERVENKGDGTTGYHAGTFGRDNLRFRFIHNHIQDSFDHQKGLIGPLHGAMAIFGVFGHIPYKAQRIAYSKAFYDLLLPGRNLLLHVPTPKMFEREMNAYQVMRDHERAFALAVEDRDFYYCKFDVTTDSASAGIASKLDGGDKTAMMETGGDAVGGAGGGYYRTSPPASRVKLVDNFYHAFTARELIDTLTSAGFSLPTTGAIEASSVSDPMDAIKSLANAEGDALAARRVTYNNADLDYKKRIPDEARIENLCTYVHVFAARPDVEEMVREAAATAASRHAVTAAGAGHTAAAAGSECFVARRV